MTPEQAYCFDISGYIVLRGVFTSSQTAALTRATISEKLTRHSAVSSCLAALAGVGTYQPHGEPQLLASRSAGASGSKLSVLSEPTALERQRAYDCQNGVRLCERLVAVIALSHGSEFGLSPASHQSKFELPRGAASLPFLYPALAAGDVVLLCDGLTFVHSSSSDEQRLLMCRFQTEVALSMAGQTSIVGPYYTGKGPGLPAWAASLGPEQRAVLAGETPGPHPALFDAAGAAGVGEMDAVEAFNWDKDGFLVLPGVMGGEWLRAANAAVVAHESSIVLDTGSGNRRVGQNGSARLSGKGRRTLSGLMALPPPHCDPFHAMLAHPAIITRALWMLGPGFRYETADLICSEAGSSSGELLHGGALGSN
jgi:hypothetical protein